MGYAGREDLVPEDEVPLGALPPRPGEDELLYEYDSGDDREVRIVFTRFVAPVRPPRRRATTIRATAHRDPDYR